MSEKQNSMIVRNCFLRYNEENLCASGTLRLQFYLLIFAKGYASKIKGEAYDDVI